MAYGMFESMELVIRHFLQFFWAIVSVEWEEEESLICWSKIIEHHVTIRGFLFASGWLEKHKKTQKKTIKKSKGVRKQLSSSSQSFSQRRLVHNYYNYDEITYKHVFK